VLSASVTVDSELVSSIGRGVLVFAAVAPEDTEKEAESLAARVLKLRLWDDETGRVGRTLEQLMVVCIAEVVSYIINMLLALYSGN
jgi:D-tyrosyl-tRNA(Tyr) deacylase